MHTSHIRLKKRVYMLNDSCGWLSIREVLDAIVLIAADRGFAVCWPPGSRLLVCVPASDGGAGSFRVYIPLFRLNPN